jgi:hypothetical protein
VGSIERRFARSPARVPWLCSADVARYSPDQMSAIEIGIPGIEPLSGVAKRPDRWALLEAQMMKRHFWRSDGFRSPVGAPQKLSGELLEQSRAFTEKLDRFYRAAIDAYFSTPGIRADFLVHPDFAPAMDAEPRDQAPLPLSRLDLVRTTDGTLKVIEINPTGMSLPHLRSAFYLARALLRAKEESDARAVDAFATMMVEAFSRHAGEPGRKLTVGVPILPGHVVKLTQLMFRGAFLRNGWGYVFAPENTLELTKDGASLGGRKIDLLWTDYVFYLAYQFKRYQETRFATKVGDYSAAPSVAARILDDPHFLAGLRERRIKIIEPFRSFLALSKGLLAWPHRADRPVPADLRSFLEKHVARTYALVERDKGVLTRSDALGAKDRLLIKPCQYGGAHGVVAGREASKEEWKAAVDRVWEDPQWVLQEYFEPCRTPDGEYVSIGLYSYAGKFGGMTLRTSKTCVISARDSRFIAVVPEDRLDDRAPRG